MATVKVMLMGFLLDNDTNKPKQHSRDLSQSYKFFFTQPITYSQNTIVLNLLRFTITFFSF